MSIPNDPYLELQWHLQNNVTGMLDLNLIRVWSNTDATDAPIPIYSCAGMRLVLVSDGFDYNHHDISANYNTSLDYDFEFSRNDAFGSATDVTGTALAGLIAASANGRGTVGIAYDAELIGYRMSWPWGSEGISSVAAVIERALSNAQADVTVFAQQSLGSAYDAGPAVVDPNIIAQIRERVDVALSSGRGGLGMTIVKSAGDSHYDPEWYNPPYNVNLDPWASDSRQIAVTGVDESGFTNNTSGAGTPILVSAFSADNYSYYSKMSNLFTTDSTGTAGQTSRDYVYDFGGTAAATAIVAGVVSLMYEANPGLGWRDVQAILAASARHVGSEVGTNFSNWQWNASTTLACPH